MREKTSPSPSTCMYLCIAETKNFCGIYFRQYGKSHILKSDEIITTGEKDSRIEIFVKESSWRKISSFTVVIVDTCLTGIERQEEEVKERGREGDEREGYMYIKNSHLRSSIATAERTLCSQASLACRNFSLSSTSENTSILLKKPTTLRQAGSWMDPRS